MSKQHRTQAAVASSRGSRRLKRSAWMLSAAVAAIALYSPAHAQLAPDALPTGGTVVAGSATIGTPTPAAMQVDQSSNRAVINWNSFDIGSGASVVFNQPSNTSITVNRVVSGAAPSEIAGSMSANGIVAVLNPNGVLFSGSANVDVGGLIASTGDIDQAAFMADGGTLDIAGANGGEIVISAGADISITNAGLGAFVAPTVRNSGTITATGGRVQLGAGSTFTLDLAGDGLLAIGLGADSPLIENFGDISGRRIEMTARQAAAVVDQTIRTGVLPVGSVRVDGTAIVLDAAGEDFAVSSDITGTGNVTVNANRIYGAADLNVDGNLTLNVNSQGAVADTTVGSVNWINDALGVIGSQVDATRINLGAGLYRSGTVINNSNVTIDGHGAARIGWTSGIENAVDIWGDNVAIANLEIFGPADSAYTSFAWGSTNSRGIFVHNGADNAVVLSNNIHDIRTGIIVDGRNLNTFVIGNRVENTKSGISVQYSNGGDAATSGVAASSITLLDNYEGAIGNEWGINVHLNGILQADGSTINPSTSMVGGVPVGVLGTASLAEQQRLVALGAANSGMSVQNIAYSAANRTRAYVVAGGGTNTQGSQLSALGSVQAGVDALVTGGTLYVADGTYNLGSSPIRIVRGLTLIGASQAGVILDGRSASANGLGTIQVQADNVSLSNFTLYGSEVSGGNYGIKVQPNPSGHVNTPGGDDQRLNNFAISDVTVRGSRRAELDLNGVVGATINNFTADGRRVADGTGTEGAGVQITDSSGVTLTGVHTMGNNWGGVALYQSNKASGYDGQTTNITINAALNQFDEANGLFSQLESTTQSFGTLNLTGFDYAVRNTGHRPDGSGFVYFQTGLANASAFALALANAGTGSIEGYSGSDFTNIFTVVNGLAINSALRDARDGATINVRPGDYLEGVTGVGTYGGAGGQQFGLHVTKNNITLRGVDAIGQAIGSADDVAAFITAGYQTGFGAQHFVSGSGVTIEGLGFRPAAAGTRKTFEVIGDAFTMRNSVIDNRGNATEVNFYISDFDDPTKPRVESFTLENNIFYGGTTPSTMVLVAGGAGRNTAASNRVFSGNRVIGSSLRGQSGIRIEGIATATAPWAVLTTGAVTITNNSFDNVDAPIRALGVMTEGLDWDAIFRSNGNAFLDGAVLAYEGSSLNARAGVNAYGDLDYRITSKISDSVARAVAGDTVRMLDGTYDLGTSQLMIDKSISLVGQSQAGVVIDGRAVSDGGGLGTILVAADNVSLSGFTLYGSEVTGGNYGIKVQPNPLGYNPSQRLNNFAISDVTVRGARRAELDLNGVIGATITNFTADGRRVADGAVTGGAGVQITDSANVTLTGVHTFGNDWGGVALYQANRSGAYDGQTTNINIDASQNQFEEALGLFSQLESTTQGFGALNLTGFNYAVRNTDHRPDNLDAQFIFYRTSQSDAIDFANTVGTASASSIEGFANGLTNVFTVVDGLSINAATRDVRAGGTVNVGAGTYNEAVSITRSLTLAGAGIDATSITGGMAITSGFTGLTLRDFAVSGSASGTSVISNSGVLTNLTVDGVRIDGANVADRHGFIGGQIGGDIAITDSEFLNIRGWAAFDTRSGAGGNDGAQITSGLFANNRIDNTIGHIAFRQQIGAATLPNVTFSGNTVTNTGNATNSFGAIFKAFNADTVDFTGNTVSGVGTSGFNPAGEAAYGAVLMTRGAATLNVTGNSFTNNNQVLAIEPGRGLATVTNISNNSFTNNGYSIYLPTNLAGAGTINFGAGNNFVAGANTVQHIVWRSAAALDLSNVAFNGVLASDMNLAGRFALADLISDGIDRSGAGLAALVGGELYVTTGSGTDAALRALGLAAAGDTINLSSGTHVLSNTLFVTKDGISVLGQGSGFTTINASGHNNYGIRVHGDDVTLGGFALLGSSAAVGNANYGIKVETPGDLNARNTGFEIRDVAISGSRRTGLDLNAAVDALIDGVSVTGVINGNGIAIVDSANITVRNSSTTGNAWGGLALYQTNNIASGGRNQQLTGITIEANNAFSEAAGLYLQDSSTMFDPGVLTLGGYAYAVRNFAHRSDGNQFIFFEKDLAAASAHALGLGTPSSSSIEGYAGDHYSNVFTVVDGLGIAAATRDVRTNGTINVGAGTYASGSTITANGVTLNGAAGARIDATHNGDNGITINADGVTVQGFEIFGAADQPFNLYGWGSAITRGVVVLNGADNATVTGNNIHDVRNGVLIDGRNTGAAITGNTIDNTKSAISVQYTDGSNINLSANAEGANGNEWGIIAHLNGIWNGTTITPSGGALGAATPLSEQQRLLALSAANNGMAVYNQAWSALNRTRAYVTTAGTGGAQGSQLTPTSLQGGLDAVVTGGTVHIAGGTYNEDVVLNALRVLDMGAISVNSLTVGAGAAGTAIGTSITATGAIDLASGVLLSGDTSLAGGAITLGAITSPYALTLSGDTLAIGQAELASLTATGTNITTAGVTTSGAQSYTGATTLNGAYATGGGAFTVAGATTLDGATTVATGGGNAGFGTLGGANSLTVNAGTGNVSLGAVNGLTSLAATGASITTAGATTSGAQSYTGATRLNGSYTTGGGAFTVVGGTTLGGATTVATNGGNASFGTVGGANSLAVNAGSGNVALGAVNGLTSLAATGANIITAGATTSGAQSYTGATRLNGSYATGGGAFTVVGATTLGGATTVATNGGNASFGTVGGANSLTVNAGTGNVDLGAVNGLTSLAATGTSILTAGVTTSGTQSYTGATRLNGAYSSGGAFTVAGATTLGGATTVATNGANASFGTVAGAHALAINAGNGSIALGAVDGLSSLSATGAAIATAGASTSGNQQFVGATSLSGTYSTAGGDFAVEGAATLAGGTTVETQGGNAAFGALGGAQALTVDAGTGNVSLGAIDGLASLSATGAAITTLGASTTGAQSYTGATTLAGSYTTAGGALTVQGATLLGADTIIGTAGGDAALGALAGGGHALTLDAGDGAVTLAAGSDLASLEATGASIRSSGIASTGAQTYNGSAILNGSYTTAGGAFTVNGSTSTVNATSVGTAGGNATFAAIGGSGGLSVNAGAGNVALGAVDGIASLDVTGATIATAGAATAGAQSYTGATTLNGAYAAGGGFTVAGATTLSGATTVATNGADASFGTVAGGHALSIDAGAGNVALGAVDGLESLTATGAEIVTAGASTTGAQRYTGATTLAGAYTSGGAFAVDGATILAAATTVATNGGDASFGTLSGANSFAVNAGAGNVTLGAASGLASLAATGATIATVGVSTSGAQSYTGATSLNGGYVAGGGFTVAGATTLGGATSIATGGSNATLGAVGGTGSLNVEAGAGNIALGAVSGLASLTATGGTIVTAGAATTGAQSYTGAMTLNGAYATNGGGFTVTGATTLGGATTVTSGNGTILLGAVDGASAGGQALTLDAGTGTATLGAFGAQNRLGAVSVTAGQTVLAGAGYAANSLSFSGGAGATVRLTQAMTTFNTSLPGGAGGAITIVPQLIGTVNGQQSVAFVAGNGLTLNSGDVTIGNVGSDALRLGAMTVIANDFSAQTVKLASGFTSLLSGSQVFSANTLDTLGDVVAQVAGVESGPIRAGGSVAIEAGGSGTGSIIAGGPVALGYTSDVTRSITSTGPVSVSTTGSIGGAINSGGSVNLATTAGAISGTVAATGPVTAQTTTGAITATINSTNAVTLGSTTGTIAGTVQAAGPVAATTTGGAISGSITSSSTVTLGTTSGTIGGTIQATGPVTATATTGNIAAAIQSNAGVTVGSTSGAVGGSIQAAGAVNVNAGGSVTAAVTTSGSASIASTSGGVSSTVSAGGPVTVAAPGPVTSAITSGGTVAVTSNTPVAVQVNGGTVTVNAPGGTVTGVFSDIITDSKGTFVVNEEPVIGSGTTDARQIIIDSFLAPAGGTAAADGTIQLPVGLALALIAPAGDGKGGQRPPVAVNSVERLGELLRLGYTAIIIQIDETNLDLEEELDGAAR